jgi:hypothetical protein
MWNQQVRLAWDRQRAGLPNLVRENTAFVPLIKLALVDDEKLARRNYVTSSIRFLFFAY